ncbi:MAG: fatty acid metabolism transcriptional regulator FadR [Desulfobacula sp.]|nr:fatty acid metabolism transcriptional regulator FadR [Desulfobacula sp.]
MVEKLLKPAEFAEKNLLEAILTSRYLPGTPLPAERVLSVQLGITRPTLRETLQRLSKEGWVTIQHGKPTVVNHYLENGGLAILSALARYGKTLSRGMIGHLLEVRTTMFPTIVFMAVTRDCENMLDYLRQSCDLADAPKAFANYDWELQSRMVKACGNPIFKMILNDFAPLYDILGERYFKSKKARMISLAYYNELIAALEKSRADMQEIDIKAIVEKTMHQSERLWLEVK